MEIVRPDLDQQLKGLSVDDDEDVDDDDDDNREYIANDDGKQFEVEGYDRDNYDLIAVAVNFDQLSVQEDDMRLRPVSAAHKAETMKMMMEYGEDLRYSRITGTIHPDDMPKDDVYDVIEEDLQTGPRIKAGTRIIIIDGNHRYEAMQALRAAPPKKGKTAWLFEPLQIHISVRKDLKPLHQLEIIKTGKILNTVGSHILSCNSFLEILHTVRQYAASFPEAYKMEFVEAKASFIRKDMQASGFIKGSSTSTYNRYIRLTKLCIRCPELYALIEDLNSREPLHGSKTVTQLNLISLCNTELDVAEPDYIPFLVEGAWWCLNKVVPSNYMRNNFNPGAFYPYAANMLKELVNLHARVIDRCETFNEFLKTTLSTGANRQPQSIKHVAMTQLRLFTDPAQRSDQAGTTKLNDDRTKRLQKRVELFFFPDTPATSSATARKPSTRKPTPAPRPPQTTIIDLENPDTEITPAPVLSVSASLSTRPRRSPNPTSIFLPSALPTRKAKKRKRALSTEEQSGSEYSDEESDEEVHPARKQQPRKRPPRKKKKKMTSGRSSEVSNNSDDDDLLPFDDTPSNVPPVGLRDRFATALNRAVPVLNTKIRHEMVLHDSMKITPKTQIHGTKPSCWSSTNTKSTRVTNTAPQLTRVQFEEDDPTPALRAGHIPSLHRANAFFDKEDVEYAKNMAKVWGTYAALKVFGEIGDHRTQRKVFDSVFERYNSTIHAVYFNARGAELEAKGYTILEDMADPTNAQLYGQSKLPFPIPKNVPQESRQHFFNHVEGTLDQRVALKRTDKNIWYTIFNHADERDEKDRANGHARFSTTREFNVNYLNTKERLWMLRYMSFMDVYLGQLALLVGCYKLNNINLFFPTTGGRFLYTGPYSPAQDGHNDFDHREGKGPGFFVMVTGNEGSSLWVADGSHNISQHAPHRRKKIARTLRMHLIKIPPNSVFIAHGWLQHAGAAWSGSGNLRYHMYLIPEGHDLRDGIAYAYDTNFKRGDEDSSESSDENDQDGSDDGSAVNIPKNTPNPEDSVGGEELEEDSPIDLNEDEFDLGEDDEENDLDFDEG